MSVIWWKLSKDPYPGPAYLDYFVFLFEYDQPKSPLTDKSSNQRGHGYKILVSIWLKNIGMILRRNWGNEKETRQKQG